MGGGLARRCRSLLALTAVALLCAAGCAGMLALHAIPRPRRAIFSTTVTLDDGQPFELHLAGAAKSAGARRARALRERRWRLVRARSDMFRAVGDAGFYAVGLSSARCSTALAGGAAADGVQELARGLPGDPGPGLRRAEPAAGPPGRADGMVAGGQPGGPGRRAPATRQRNLAGIVAIGLTADENLSVTSDTDDDPDDNGSRPESIESEPRHVSRCWRRWRRGGAPSSRRPATATCRQPVRGSCSEPIRHCAASTRCRRRTTGSAAARRRSPPACASAGLDDRQVTADWLTSARQDTRASPPSSTASRGRRAGPSRPRSAGCPCSRGRPRARR